MKYENVAAVGSGECAIRRSQIEESGFTLLELLTTISVASVIMAVAIPSFSSFVQNDSLTTQANLLVSSLNFARSEGVKRDARVSICPSTGALSGGQPSCDSSSWASGWIVYAVNGANVTTLQAIPKLASGTALTSSSAGAAVSLVSYRPDGSIAPVNGGTSGSPVSFVLCDSRGGAHAVSIELSAMGRPQASQISGRTIANAALSCG